MRLALSSSIVAVRLSTESQHSLRCPVHGLGGSIGCVGLRGPLHLLSVSTLSRTPYASCAVAHVAANPLHAGAPSLNDGECLTHPAGVRAPGPCLHVANRYPLLGFSVRYGRLRLGAFQLCPLRDHAVLDVAPQGNQQPPRQGHDADAPHARLPPAAKRRVNQALSALRA